MLDPQGPARLPWLEAIAAAAQQSLFGPTLRESVEAGIELRRLLTGNAEAAESAHRFVADYRPPPGGTPALSAPVAAPAPVAQTATRSAVVQGSLLL